MAMLRQLDYVQHFALIPCFCRLEPKLPKGYKKNDGRRVVITEGFNRYKEKRTEYIVECGADIYISGIIRKSSPNKSEQEQWLAVEDWKSMTAIQVIDGIERDGKPVQRQIKDAIFQLYKDSGLPIGYVTPTLRDI